MLIKGGFCLAGGSDGRGRCTFTPVAFVINLVPSTTGSSEQPSLKSPQLQLQWMAASPQELFAIDTSIQAHHRAVSISSPNSSPRPSKSTPARLRLLLTTLGVFFLVVFAGTKGFTPSDTFPACSGKGRKHSAMHWERNHRAVLQSVQCALSILRARHTGTPRGTQGTSWVHLHPTSCVNWDLGTKGNSFQHQILKALILW